MANEPDAAEEQSEGPFLPDNVPLFSASGIRLAETGNDFVITFTAPRTGTVGTDEPAIMGASVCSLALSWQTTKDLYLILEKHIQKLEEEYGEIESPYTRKTARDNG